MENPGNSHKGSATFRKLRFITGCMLIGSVTAGAFLAWLPLPFDIRLVGIAFGAVAGLALERSSWQ